MDKEHTCCVTGHRNIPADKIQYVQMQLRQELLQAIQSGYTHFISGFAAGMRSSIPRAAIWCATIIW